MTWRKLRVLIDHLPEDSHTARALGEVTPGEWSLAEHFQAATVDLLRILNWRLENLGAPRNKQSKPPKPIPRPSDATDEKQQDEIPVVKPSQLQNWVHGGELM